MDMQTVPVEGGDVLYTYDIKWEVTAQLGCPQVISSVIFACVQYSDIKWASRWDLYLYMGDEQIHW